MTYMPSCEVDVSRCDISEIGAVVIGRNEGERLLRCIGSLTGKVATIIYVDSASTDGSAAIAQDHGAHVVELKADLPLTAARGRQAGFELLRQRMPDCRYVQFVDGDCIIQDGWLDAASAFLDGKPDAAVVCGRRFEAFPAASFYNRLIDKEWDTPLGQVSACGGDSLMRASALREAGSFRAELLAGEEPEVCTRLASMGWTIWRIDARMTEHDAKIDRLSQWLRRARRGGAGYAQVWSITRKIKRPLYGRQMTSALLWVVGVPIASIVLALSTRQWAMLALFPILWCVQIMRIATRRSSSEAFGSRLKVGAIVMLTKFAEAVGILSFLAGMKRQETTYRGDEDSFSVSSGSA